MDFPLPGYSTHRVADAHPVQLVHRPFRHRSNDRQQIPLRVRQVVLMTRWMRLVQPLFKYASATGRLGRPARILEGMPGCLEKHEKPKRPELEPTV